MVEHLLRSTLLQEEHLLRMEHQLRGTLLWVEHQLQEHSATRGASVKGGASAKEARMQRWTSGAGSPTAEKYL